MNLKYLKELHKYDGNGWNGWEDFLPYSKYKDFDDAKIYASKLGCSTRKDWYEYWKFNKRPSDIPYQVNIVYKEKGWNGWKDFFGNGYLSFIEAKKIVSSLGIKNQKEWYEYCKTKKQKNISITLWIINIILLIYLINQYNE